jgi:hypothetical protein
MRSFELRHRLLGVAGISYWQLKRGAPGANMGIIKLLVAPVRSIVRFPLFQLAVVVAVILFLQAGDDKSARGQIFNGLDELVESTVGLFSAVFNLKSFTKSWLTTGFWIAYVYLACLLILFLLREVISKMVDFVGWSNLFGLRNAIARERGIAAYRAWEPFERIRPASISQQYPEPSNRRVRARAALPRSWTDPTRH